MTTAGDGYQTYFEQAVTAAGRSFFTVTTPPTAAEMALFESVVWLTGDDYSTTLTTADQTEIAAYLDGGGRLFMSGQDIGYDIGTTAFYADYLHADYVQDDVGLGGVIGVATNPVGVGFTFNIKGGSGANNQAYPSEIDPLAGAQPAFVYDPAVPGAASDRVQDGSGGVEGEAITSSGTAGLTFDDGTYKLVYFAFGFEAIDDAATRGALMDRDPRLAPGLSGDRPHTAGRHGGHGESVRGESSHHVGLLHSGSLDVRRRVRHGRAVVHGPDVRDGQSRRVRGVHPRRSRSTRR